MNRIHLGLSLLLCACGVRTDLSYEELVDEHRDEYGPFADCGFESNRCDGGVGASAACLADGISRCSPVEHVFFDGEGETATTFVTPTADGCEVVVFRDLGRGSVGTDVQRERCDAVEVIPSSPCIRFLRCDVERRWNQRR